MDETLINTLSSCGQAIETWNNPEGGGVLVLPYGGRILGLFAPGSSHNFLWTHPALQSIESAKAFYQSNGWHNSGGDRTWIAPEVDFFLPQFPSVEFYYQPREIDPGSYRLTYESGNLALTNRFSSKLSRSGQTAHLQLTKRLIPARNPLRNCHPELAEKLAFAGYSVSSRLEVEGDNPPRVGFWSLLQMPFNGELVIPTLSMSAVQIYMGRIEPEDLTVTENLIRYRMRSVGEHKLGIPSAVVIGRVGYFYVQNGESCLVIRNFQVNPSGEYIDVPWHNTACDGAAVEACNVNSGLGSFSELEYHAPAIGGGDGSRWCEDESQVWAFRGENQDVVAAGKTLISSAL